ncbi:MAG: ABC transporter permease [Lachnospiraceae bacterium]|nr:ABC transporter permease [Lachnospiraceae bacterium]
MQVYNTLMKIVKKQLGSCAIFFGIFIFLLTMFSNTGGEQRHEYESYSCMLAIIDKDHSDASKRLSDFLAKTNTLVDIEDDEAQIQTQLYYEKVDYVLYIENGYATTGELKNIKRPGSNTGSYMDDQIKAYQNSMNILTEVGYSEKEAYELTCDAASDEGLVTMMNKVTSNRPSIFYFFMYIPYVLIMMLFTGLTPILVAYHRKEVNDRVNVSSMPVRKRNFQLVLATFTISFGFWVLFMVLGFVYNGSKMVKGMHPYCILNSFVFAVIAMSMVCVAGNFRLDSQKISMISNIVGLGMCFLGGVFVPMEIFGDGLIAVSRFLPTHWYVRANDLIFEEASVSEIMQCIGVECLFAVAFLAVALLVSKRRRLARSS